jgi:uncharacterized protein YbjT (DUF2867 family)
MTEPQRVLLVGPGTFGQVVARQLLAKGLKVTILARDPKKIPEDVIKAGANVFQGDLTNVTSLDAATKDIDTVIRYVGQITSFSFPDVLA